MWKHYITSRETCRKIKFSFWASGKATGFDLIQYCTSAFKAEVFFYEENQYISVKRPNLFQFFRL